MVRKFCVGGNWKMNGTKDSITELSKILTTGPLDPNVEVRKQKLLVVMSQTKKLSIFHFRE